MLWLFFPIFGFWWWLLLAAGLGWILILEECERPAEAAGVLAGFLVITAFLGDAGRLFLWAAHHGWSTLALIIVYLGTGFLWGVFRYWWEQSIAVAKYNDQKIEFLRKKGFNLPNLASEIPSQFLDEWIDQIGASRYSGRDNVRKFFHEQKKRVINWMSWWWLSMVSFLLKDFVLRFYTIVLNRTRVIFEGIDRAVWRGTAEDFSQVERHLEAKRILADAETQRQREARVR